MRILAIFSCTIFALGLTSDAFALGGILSSFKNAATQIKNDVTKSANEAKNSVKAAANQAVTNFAAGISKGAKDVANGITQVVQSVVQPYPPIDPVIKDQIDNLLASQPQFLSISHINCSDPNVVLYICTKIKELYDNAGYVNLFVKLPANITIEGLQALFETLKSCPAIFKALSFEGMALGDNAATILIGYLPSFPMLEYIIFDNAQITDQGVSSLISALTKNCGAVSLLSLARNPITPPTIQNINAMLKTTPDDFLTDGLLLPETAQAAPIPAFAAPNAQPFQPPYPGATQPFQVPAQSPYPGGAQPPFQATATQQFQAPAPQLQSQFQQPFQGAQQPFQAPTQFQPPYWKM
ncbi:hypothetical protein FACS1894113_0080 [Alphaproteobacteria bacterium]|nr:hypothetical protein FACS1894113_0080 [Alphaproteobacteria bacterium]